MDRYMVRLAFALSIFASAGVGCKSAQERCNESRVRAHDALVALGVDGHSRARAMPPPTAALATLAGRDASEPARDSVSRWYRFLEIRTFDDGSGGINGVPDFFTLLNGQSFEEQAGHESTIGTIQFGSNNYVKVEYLFSHLRLPDGWNVPAAEWAAMIRTGEAFRLDVLRVEGDALVLCGDRSAARGMK